MHSAITIACWRGRKADIEPTPDGIKKGEAQSFAFFHDLQLCSIFDEWDRLEL
jgi:hypothetical protein